MQVSWWGGDGIEIGSEMLRGISYSKSRMVMYRDGTLLRNGIKDEKQRWRMR